MDANAMVLTAKTLAAIANQLTAQKDSFIQADTLKVTIPKEGLTTQNQDTVTTSATAATADIPSFTGQKRFDTEGVLARLTSKYPLH